MLLHDTARPHLARITREKIFDLDFSVLPHELYSPDLALSNFHIFRFLQNARNDKKFSKEDQVKMFGENFLSSKPAEIYLRGIDKQLVKWQELIQNNDEYTIDRN